MYLSAFLGEAGALSWSGNPGWRTRMKMLTLWARIGGAALLVFVLSLLTKGVADVGELTGTVNALVSRVDQLRTDMDGRFHDMDSRFRRLETEMDSRFREMDDRFDQFEGRMEQRFAQMDNRFLQMDNRFLRIENVLMGRPPDADDIGGASESERAVPNPRPR